MASKQFLAALRNVRENKNLEMVLIGSDRLEEGTHDVTIQSVDSSEIDSDKVKMTFVDDSGRKYVDNVFLMAASGEEFSYGLRKLWAALIPDKNAIGTFIDLLTAGDDKVFEMFTGMKLKITLRPGKGVQARATGLGTFQGYDVETNSPVTETYSEIKEVYNEIKARALKRSYLQIRATEATTPEANLAAFEFAATAKKNTGNNVVSAFMVG